MDCQLFFWSLIQHKSPRKNKNWKKKTRKKNICIASKHMHNILLSEENNRKSIKIGSRSLECVQQLAFTYIYWCVVMVQHNNDKADTREALDQILFVKTWRVASLLFPLLYIKLYQSPFGRTFPSCIKHWLKFKHLFSVFFISRFVLVWLGRSLLSHFWLDVDLFGAFFFF